jgi:serine/threonine-protein kinase PRP4
LTPTPLWLPGSPFYRAPEVILGREVGPGVDMWALGCTLYELYTSRILFKGHGNNQILGDIMAVTGKPAGKYLRRGVHFAQHFDENLNFRTWAVDEATQRSKTIVVANLQPTRNLSDELYGAHEALTPGEHAKVGQLAALLTAMLAFNPEKRITPSEALQHPFITEPMA